MWWEITATGLTVITLVVVTGMTMLGVVGLAEPVVFGRCRECLRFMLDFHAAPEHALCHRCRRARPPMRPIEHPLLR